jgi:type I restriction enzyme R subunit
VLFVGLTPYAAVEAKRANTDVAGKVPQAERYCRDFQPSAEAEVKSNGWGPQGEYRIPFAFSSNGRPFLNQLRTKSGIWFRDHRRSENLAGPLERWYSPEGLKALGRQDLDLADQQLRRGVGSGAAPVPVPGVGGMKNANAWHRHARQG